MSQNDVNSERTISVIHSVTIKLPTVRNRNHSERAYRKKINLANSPELWGQPVIRKLNKRHVCLANDK